jgi:hypothetical protein
LDGWGIRDEDYIVNDSGKLDMSKEIKDKFANIALGDNSNEALTVAKIRTPLNDLVVKAIVADSDAQIEQLYKDAIAQFELDGLSDLEKSVQAAIDARRK